MLKLALQHIRCYTVHTNNFFVNRTPLYAWLTSLSVCLFCPYAHLFSIYHTSHAACPCTSSHLILQAYVLTGFFFSFLPPLLRTDPVETMSGHIHVSFPSTLEGIQPHLLSIWQLQFLQIPRLSLTLHNGLSYTWDTSPP